MLWSWAFAKTEIKKKVRRRAGRLCFGTMYLTVFYENETGSGCEHLIAKIKIIELV
jgi:hypothetical protein